ncbi:uncharacterized protein [Hemitrygon akajei]|uniref:uncharacterized protein n=1 Tax=Hemitrygon akajei TaxID=2704970 RepID=UPI003BF9E7C2
MGPWLVVRSLCETWELWETSSLPDNYICTRDSMRVRETTKWDVPSQLTGTSPSQHSKGAWGPVGVHDLQLQLKLPQAVDSHSQTCREAWCFDISRCGRKKFTFGVWSCGHPGSSPMSLAWSTKELHETERNLDTQAVCTAIGRRPQYFSDPSLSLLMVYESLLVLKLEDSNDTADRNIETVSCWSPALVGYRSDISLTLAIERQSF